MCVSCSIRATACIHGPENRHPRFRNRTPAEAGETRQFNHRPIHQCNRMARSETRDLLCDSHHEQRKALGEIASPCAYDKVRFGPRSVVQGPFGEIARTVGATALHVNERYMLQKEPAAL
ncbi:hypothetical protein LY39_03019 [Roseinatronobacter bogoriensis subsp. barguzinensis]|nr:hypothetical protein [Rhodobaca bogoriensis DSM 18756]TDW36041.1 hypothetical protein LY39_03019 [Rhodobaca barguzinensis]TDY74054.1 hypothetical protein EV660_10186 [Rhodobaca bogoriensis DSM 18756]